MRILFVANAYSIHTARWINQLDESGYEIHLYDCMKGAGLYPDFLHPDLRNVTLHNVAVRRRSVHDSIATPFAFRWPFTKGADRLSQFIGKIRDPIYHPSTPNELARLINRIKPDIVHSLETQKNGYFTFEALQYLKINHPIWIHSIWGSDIYLFERLPQHRVKVQTLLKICDILHCECERDVRLARAAGFSGNFFPIVQMTGGFNMVKINSLYTSIQPSRRRLILVNGYQGLIGRALFALRAIKECATLLKDSTIGIYSANEDIRNIAELQKQETGINIIAYNRLTHDEMLTRFASARIYLSCSISDGVPNSMLEAMVMGAFPIQSYTSAADEWISHLENGMLVDPEDVKNITEALMRALTDDKLVDEAAQYNRKLIERRLDSKNIIPKVVAAYQRVMTI